jgi:hypothetical protein
MIASQVEYRVLLPKRFGPAALGGIGWKGDFQNQ